MLTMSQEQQRSMVESLKEYAYEGDCIRYDVYWVSGTRQFVIGFDTEREGDTVLQFEGFTVLLDPGTAHELEKTPIHVN
jgi:Fe-S cluster assembly iron-binding protein IscA